MATSADFDRWHSMYNQRKMFYFRFRNGFSLIEMLLVVGILGALSAVVFLSVDPLQQIEKARDANRTATSNQLQKAFEQLVTDTGNLGSLEALPTLWRLAVAICSEGSMADETCFNADALVPKYLHKIPKDSKEPNPHYTGYMAWNNRGRVTVFPSYIYDGISTNMLLSRWNFEELQGGATADVMGAHTPAIFVGSPEWVTSTPPTHFYNRGSLHFNGVDQYIDLGNPADLSPGINSITVMAWAQTTDLTDAITIFGTNWASCAAIELRTAGGYPQWIIEEAGNCSSRISGSTFVADGQWHHLAGVRDVASGTLRLYVDGRLDAMGIASLADITSTTGYVIAARDPGELLWHGLIDDVRVYQRALTGEEIAAIAAGTH